MAHRVPTKVGDVLILRTERSFKVYAVGRVAKDDQQDLQGQENVDYVTSRMAAVAKARALVAPGRGIFLQNIDTGHWSEISNG
jgi:hypothetical protein